MNYNEDFGSTILKTETHGYRPRAYVCLIYHSDDTMDKKILSALLY